MRSINKGKWKRGFLLFQSDLVLSRKFFAGNALLLLRMDAVKFCLKLFFELAQRQRICGYVFVFTRTQTIFVLAASGNRPSFVFRSHTSSFLRLESQSSTLCVYVATLTYISDFSVDFTFLVKRVRVLVLPIASSVIKPK